MKMTVFVDVEGQTTQSFTYTWRITSVHSTREMLATQYVPQYVRWFDTLSFRMFVLNDSTRRILAVMAVTAALLYMT